MKESAKAPFKGDPKGGAQGEASRPFKGGPKGGGRREGGRRASQEGGFEGREASKGRRLRRRSLREGGGGFEGGGFEGERGLRSVEGFEGGRELRREGREEGGMDPSPKGGLHFARLGRTKTSHIILSVFSD